MPHSADSSFFITKRPWSKRKDLILRHYIKPYTQKIATQRKPILFVDGFAGPGRYQDGEIGSPMILATHVHKVLKGGLKVKASLLAIEFDKQLHSQLESNLNGFDFATVRNSSFLDSISEIRNLSTTHSVFLYVDPYAIEGLDWSALDSVFELLTKGSSIEILLNFNVQAFARRGRAALSMSKPNTEGLGGIDEDDWEQALESNVQIERLNDVAGGKWWQGVLSTNSDFVTELKALTEGFCNRLRTRFREVFVHEIKAKESHTVPKYVLIFGSRSDHSIPLINDAAVRSLELFAEEQKPVESTLFETRSTDIVPDVNEVFEAITRLTPTGQSNGIKRRQLTIKTIRAVPGRHLVSAINGVISDKIKSGRLISETGKSRINDDVKVWKP